MRSGLSSQGAAQDWKKTPFPLQKQQHVIYIQQGFPNCDIHTANHHQAAPSTEMELPVPTLVQAAESTEPYAKAGWSHSISHALVSASWCTAPASSFLKTAQLPCVCLTRLCCFVFGGMKPFKKPSWCSVGALPRASTSFP